VIPLGIRLDDEWGLHDLFFGSNSMVVCDVDNAIKKSLDIADDAFGVQAWSPTS